MYYLIIRSVEIEVSGSSHFLLSQLRIVVSKCLCKLELIYVRVSTQTITYCQFYFEVEIKEYDSWYWVDHILRDFLFDINVTVLMLSDTRAVDICFEILAVSD